MTAEKAAMLRGMRPGGLAIRTDLVWQGQPVWLLGNSPAIEDDPQEFAISVLVERSGVLDRHEATDCPWAVDIDLGDRSAPSAHIRENRLLPVTGAVLVS